MYEPTYAGQQDGTNDMVAIRLLTVKRLTSI